jgi:uncharacterized phage protein (TIGR01671 family)
MVEVMREILFRGKREDGTWTYGYYMYDLWNDYKYYIIGADKGYAYKVIPETVGQYTGQLDKNGRKVFERDILKHTPRPNCDIYYKVFWFQECFRFSLVQWSTHSVSLYKHFNDVDVEYSCEVIGNIYDNPSLLESLEECSDYVVI